MSNTVDLYSALAPDALAAFLADMLAPRVARTSELLNANRRFLTATAAGITTPDVAGKATDFIRQLAAEVKEVEFARTAIKAPVLAAQRQIDGEGRKLTEPLVAAKVEAERRITAYLRAAEQAQRQAAAEKAAWAAKEAAEAAVVAETANDPEVIDAAIERAEEAMEVGAQAAAVLDAPAKEVAPQIRTGLGSTTTLREVWTYEVIDMMTLLRAIVAGEVPLDAAQVNADYLKMLVKRKGEARLPGVRVDAEGKAVVR